MDVVGDHRQIGAVSEDRATVEATKLGALDRDPGRGAHRQPEGGGQRPLLDQIGIGGGEVPIEQRIADRQIARGEDLKRADIGPVALGVTVIEGHGLDDDMADFPQVHLRDHRPVVRIGRAEGDRRVLAPCQPPQIERVIVARRDQNRVARLQLRPDPRQPGRIRDLPVARQCGQRPEYEKTDGQKPTPSDAGCMPRGECDLLHRCLPVPGHFLRL